MNDFVHFKISLSSIYLSVIDVFGYTNVFRNIQCVLYKVEAIIFKIQMYMNVCIVNAMEHKKQYYL